MATRPSAPTRKRAGGTDDGVADPALPQKKRARHRLIGAIALCLLAAIVVPLLLESEPTRPVSDVSIVIPSRDTPLPPRAAEPRQDTKVEGKNDTRPEPKSAAEPSRGVVARGTIDTAPAEPKSGDGAAREAVTKDAAKDAAKGTSDTKPADPKAAKGDAAKGDAAKGDAAKGDAAKGGRGDEIQQLADAAQAKARGDTMGRYLLQVGAYGAESGANAAVERVRATGLRAFTEKVKTDRGDRVRVRVGPFPSRETAEQARARLKAAGVESALIAP